MLDPVDMDPPRVIVDAIKDTIVPDPEPMSLFGRHFDGARRAGVPGKEAHSLDDAPEDRSAKLIEVLLRRREDEDLIHGAS